MNGATRGRLAAAADSAGAAVGSVGPMVFAIVLWRFLPKHNAVLVILCATVAWAMTAFALWVLREQV